MGPHARACRARAPRCRVFSPASRPRSLVSLPPAGRRNGGSGIAPDPGELLLRIRAAPAGSSRGSTATTWISTRGWCGCAARGGANAPCPWDARARPRCGRISPGAARRPERTNRSSPGGAAAGSGRAASSTWPRAGCGCWRARRGTPTSSPPNFATHLLDRGAGCARCRRCWETPLRSTQVYTHLTVERLRETYDRAIHDRPGTHEPCAGGGARAGRTSHAQTSTIAAGPVARGGARGPQPFAAAEDRNTPRRAASPAGGEIHRPHLSQAQPAHQGEFRSGHDPGLGEIPRWCCRRPRSGWEAARPSATWRACSAATWTRW